MELGRKSLAFILLALAVCYKITERPPIKETVEYDEPYTSFEIKSPLLYGATLKFFRYIVNLPVIGTFCCSVLYRLNEYHIVRDFGYHLDVLPQYIPLERLTDVELERHQTMMAQSSPLSSLLSVDKFSDLEKLLGPSSSTIDGSLITVEQIVSAYRSKKTTPTDFVLQSLSAAQQLAHLNIFTQLDREDVLKQAQASSKRWLNSKPLSILDGVPIAVKDEINVRGYFTTHGTDFMSMLSNKSASDHTIVRRLRKLGAIIFGKTNMHEIGLFPSGYNQKYGRAGNPYSVKLWHDTGGSSSGSGAAVASGIVPLALGADGGGSVRIPAAYTGIVGLKATYGRIPFLPVDAAWSCVHFGFLSQTVRDQAIGYAAIAGHADSDGTVDDDTDDVLPVPVHLYGMHATQDLRGLRIGVYWDWFMHSDGVVHQQCKQVVDKLVNEYGATLVNVTLPKLQVMQKAHSIVILSEWIAGNHKLLNNERVRGYSNYSFADATDVTLKFVQSQIDIVDLISALKMRRWMMKYMKQNVFDRIDVLVTPSASITAPKYANLDSITASVLDTETVSKTVRFSFLANFVGIPAMTLPIGYTKTDGNGETFEDESNFPVSMQLMSDHWNEHMLFRVANVIESKLIKRVLPFNKYTYHL